MTGLQWKVEEVPICQGTPFNLIKHPETLHRNAPLEKLQHMNGNLDKRASFSYFTSLCSECMGSWACSDLVSSQHSVTKSHHEPGTKQTKQNLLYMSLTNKLRNNLRSTQENSLSSSVGPSPIPTTLTRLFPVLLPWIH